MFALIVYNTFSASCERAFALCLRGRGRWRAGRSA